MVSPPWLICKSRELSEFTPRPMSRGGQDRHWSHSTDEPTEPGVCGAWLLSPDPQPGGLVAACRGCREVGVQGDGCRVIGVQGDGGAGRLGCRETGPQLATTPWGRGPGLPEPGPSPRLHDQPHCCFWPDSWPLRLPPCQLLRTGHPATPRRSRLSARTGRWRAGGSPAQESSLTRGNSIF